MLSLALIGQAGRALEGRAEESPRSGVVSGSPPSRSVAHQPMTALAITTTAVTQSDTRPVDRDTPPSPDPRTAHRRALRRGIAPTPRGAANIDARGGTSPGPVECDTRRDEALGIPARTPESASCGHPASANHIRSRRGRPTGRRRVEGAAADGCQRTVTEQAVGDRALPKMRPVRAVCACSESPLGHRVEVPWSVRPVGTRPTVLCPPCSVDVRCPMGSTSSTVPWLTTILAPPSPGFPGRIPARVLRRAPPRLPRRLRAGRRDRRSRGR